MKNIRKIVAILSAVLMLCSLLPISAFAAAGDVAVDVNFDNGTDGFNSDSPISADGGYLTFDATVLDWANTYLYANNVKANTMYKVTFSAKANKETQMNFKVNNNWSGDVFAEAVDVTTEWADYELSLKDLELTGTALVMFTSPTNAANGAIYNIDNLKIVETVDPALIGKVINGDFSDNSGWSLGNGATIADGVLKLENINQWSEAAMQTVPVKANTNYEITWKSQRISGSGAFNMIVMNSAFANLQVISGQNWMTSTSTEWVNHTITVNTGDSEVIIFKLTTEADTSKTILLDDIKLSEIKEPSNDGYIINGDFETGKILPWDNLWGSNNVELVAGHNGDYAMKIVAGGAWTHVRQTGIAVKPNTDYVIKMFAKDAANYALLIKDNADTGNVAQYTLNTGSEWTPITFEFNSGNNSAILFSFMSNNAGDTCTVDDITMYEKVPASNDGYIINGTFETGELTPWNNLWGSCPKAEIIDGGKDSRFALEIVSGLWKHVRQMPIAVEANTDYKITVWAKNSKDMSLLVKDGGDSKDLKNAGLNAGDEWTQYTVEFNSGEYTSIIVSFMGNSEDCYGIFDNVVMEKVEPACEHEYFTPCEQYCMICGELTNPEASHNIVHVEAVAPTCTEMGNLEHWFCDVCGAAWLDEACTQNTNLRAVKLPAAHSYDYECSTTCNVCWEETRPEAAHNMIHVPAVEAIDCANPGNIEHYSCEYCGEKTDVNGNGIAPWDIAITIECVRPEGVADCATVECEICGNEIYGVGEHDTGVAPCQDGTCSKCGDEIIGFGCQNFDTPACEDGVCSYCGAFVAGFGHENGAWAPCLEGECAYGCGLKYPAEGDHVDEDANGICDNCWNCAGEHTFDAFDPCYGGECTVCWAWVAGEHTYDDEYDADCNVCGDIREVPEKPVVEIVYGDADGDGEITNIDAALLQQYLSGQDVTVNEVSADADGDGEVTNIDAALLQQYLSGWDVELGPEEEEKIFNDGVLAWGN